MLSQVFCVSQGDRAETGQVQSLLEDYSGKEIRPGGNIFLRCDCDRLQSLAYER